MIPGTGFSGVGWRSISKGLLPLETARKKRQGMTRIFVS